MELITHATKIIKESPAYTLIAFIAFAIGVFGVLPNLPQAGVAQYSEAFGFGFPNVPELSCDVSLSTTVIYEGGSTVLTWSSVGAETLTINGEPQPLENASGMEVFPPQSMSYEVVVTNEFATASCSATVTVLPKPEPEPPTCDSFTASPSELVGSGDVTLAWDTTDADTVTIDNGVGSVATDGSTVVSVSDDTTYTLTATNADGSDTCSTHVDVTPEPEPDLPVCESFSATPATLVGSGDVTLAWDTTDADTVTIDNGVGSVATDGSTVVSVSDDTTYTLTATNADGSDTCSTHVDVTPEPEPKFLTITAHKIVCEDESDLPDWGDDWLLGGPAITKDTAKEWVADHDSCEFESGWKFQWGPEDVFDPGDTLVGEAGGDWATFGPTDGNGKAEVVIPYSDFKNNHKLWVREVLQNGYITFSYGPNGDKNSDDYSAEMYCHTDVRNYDNYDRIFDPDIFGHYYCVSWNVPEPDRPVCESFSATPATLVGSGNVTLTWDTTDADTVSIDQGVGSVAADGSTVVSVSDDTTYTLTATNEGGTDTCSIHVDVMPVPELSCTVSLTPNAISEGESTLLTWSSKGADTLTLNGEPASLENTSGTEVFPTDSMTYTVVVTNDYGTANCSASVLVEKEVPERPSCPFVDMPDRTIVEFSQKVRTDWTIFNATTELKSVSLSAGDYKVSLASWDGYIGREDVSQPHEQWRAVVKNFGGVIATSGTIDDLEDNVREAMKVEVVNDSLTIPSLGVKVYGEHPFYPDNTSANSVFPLCVAFDKLPEPEPPTCDSFTASPNTLVGSGSVTLTWATTDADTVSIDNGVGSVAADGSEVVSVSDDTTYTLTATNADGSDTCQTSVTVTPPEPEFPTCDSFTASPDTLVGSGSVTLTWATTDADTVSIDNGVGSVAADGSEVVSVSDDTTYTLTATNADGSDTCQTSVTVTPPEPEFPTCDSFTASPDTLVGSGSVTLTWATTDADTVSIDNGVGSVAADGSEVVSVSDDTTYTLTATNADGTDTCQTSVEVTPEPTPPVCTLFTATPSSIVEGGDVVLTWNTTAADTVVIDNGVGAVAPGGSKTVTVDTDTTYTLTATNADGTDTCATSVTVTPEPVVPFCDSFTVTPGSLVGSGQVTLTWATTDATDVSIDNGIGSVSVDGNQVTSVTESTTFVLTATNGDEETTCQASVTVAPEPELPVCDSFTASPNTLVGSGSVTLTWATTDADTVSIDNGVGSVAADGSEVVSVSDDTTYTLTATNADGTDTCQTSVAVRPPEPDSPSCDAFSVTPDALTESGDVTLVWETSDATDVSIDQGVGSVSSDGSQTVSVSETTTFTLTASQGSDSDTCQATVTVEPVQVVPVCDSFTVNPGSIRSTADVTLTWNTTNADTVTIDQGVGDVAVDGSTVRSVGSDTTFTLTATTGDQVTTCQAAVDFSSGGGGGGGGSVRPRCEFTASDTDIVPGEEVVLTWENSRTSDMTIEDNRGNLLVDTEDDDDIDEDEGSITVSPTRDTTYTLTAMWGSRERECTVDISVGGVVLSSTRTQQPFISLAAVPYTGFEAGPALTTIFYALLVIWSLGIAYILVVREDSVFGFKLASGKRHEHKEYAPEHRAEPAPEVGTQREQEASHSARPIVESHSHTDVQQRAPRNLPTGTFNTNVGYASQDTGVVFDHESVAEEELYDEMTVLENRAHEAHVLLSTEALRFIVAQSESEEERLNMLDAIIEYARGSYPSEDGWVVVNKERLIECFS